MTYKRQLTVRQQMINDLLDRQNDYLTDARFAEHNGLLEEEAREYLNLCKRVMNHDHPEA